MEQDLSRFVCAHKQWYDIALREIRNGRKQSHWMWYIFPQLLGLGKSSHSQYYGIKGRGEAIAFLDDPYLGGNLLEITRVLLNLEGNNPTLIFQWPDNMKLRSCMTLFASISNDGSVFHQVLDKFFNGRMDNRTLTILGL